MTKEYVVIKEYAHKVFDSVRAPSLTEALWCYMAEEFKVRREGDLIVENYHGNETIFSHELHFIECNLKVYFGGWYIKRTHAPTKNEPLVEAFSIYNQTEIASYVKLCRRAFGKQEKLPRRAFVWPLKQGPLVTFFERKRWKQVAPDAIGQRFVIPLKTWPKVEIWDGDYDRLLEEMDV